MTKSVPTAVVRLPSMTFAALMVVLPAKQEQHVAMEGRLALVTYEFY